MSSSHSCSDVFFIFLLFVDFVCRQEEEEWNDDSLGVVVLVVVVVVIVETKSPNGFHFLTV